ncbi:mycothiol system anti-sigma-R factor [Brevibacterium luteolum]|uniref:mycothiol system anti-sigma-R factor n=1 Tax=Brevibacterium luteolum TaxID=199591 RepID=UPI0021AEFD12|nr:mycothiol system anti-sigma-R factor [Brevibacterium luteolum]MCT1830275.1 mycothiol system anti-sigma-R factor [Brevibacterium luteolum]MCT1922043.1 mycothiol system anti-sigma-R factor [Brevibacterium luteolum]
MSEEPISHTGCCDEQNRQISLMRIYNYLDGELTRDEIDVIKDHLANCSQCQDDYTIEALLKELVRRSCCQDQAPAGLAERIRARIVVERRTYVRRTFG